MCSHDALFAPLLLHFHRNIIFVCASTTPLDRSTHMPQSFQHSEGLVQSRCLIKCPLSEGINKSTKHCRIYYSWYYFPMHFLHWAQQNFLSWNDHVSEDCHSFPYHFCHSSLVWIYLSGNEVPKTDCVVHIKVSLAQYTQHNRLPSQGHQANLHMDGNDTGCLCCHITLQMHI